MEGMSLSVLELRSGASFGRFEISSCTRVIDLENSKRGRRAQGNESTAFVWNRHCLPISWRKLVFLLTGGRGPRECPKVFGWLLYRIGGTSSKDYGYRMVLAFVGR